MTRDQMINHLILHGWFPVMDLAKDRTTGLINVDGHSVWLRHQKGLVTAYRGGVVPPGSLALAQSALRGDWNQLAGVELAALLGVIERGT